MQSTTRKLSPQLFDTYKTAQNLEKLAISFNLSHKILKKLNQARFNIFYGNLKMYFKNQKQFNKEEREEIERHLLENYQNLSFYAYKTGFVDYIFYKGKDKCGKFVILFNFFKFYYKRLSNGFKNFDFMSKLQS